MYVVSRYWIGLDEVWVSRFGIEKIWTFYRVGLRLKHIADVFPRWPETIKLNVKINKENVKIWLIAWRPIRSRIRVRRIRMFLNLMDLDPQFICTDPDLVPSINKQKKSRKTLILLLCDFLWLFSLKNDVNEPSKRKKHWRLEGHWRKEQDPKPDPDPLVKCTVPRIRMRIRFFSCHGSGTPLEAKPDPDP